MSLFNIAKSLTKAVVRTAVTPIAIVADAVTAEPMFDDEGGYTARNFKNAVKDVRKAGRSFDKW